MIHNLKVFTDGVRDHWSNIVAILLDYNIQYIYQYIISNIYQYKYTSIDSTIYWSIIVGEKRPQKSWLLINGHMIYNFTCKCVFEHKLL